MSNISLSIEKLLNNIKNTKNTLVESDKNMGDVYIDSGKLAEAALNILNTPNYKEIFISESEVSQLVFPNTKNTWNSHKKAIQPHIQQNLDYFKWNNKMKKIENDKKWMKIPKLRQMIKLHKNELDWRRIINAKKWYSSFFSKFLQSQLDLMMMVLMKKSGSFIILDNSFNLINDIIDLNKLETPFNNNERLLFSFDVKSLYDSINPTVI